MQRILRGVLIAVLAGLIAGAALARPPAEGGEDPAPEELQRAMHRYFAQRLRVELSLDDSQVKAIVPRIREIERGRREARRRQAEAVRNLRRARRGGDDAALQDSLDRMAGVDDAKARWLERERELFGEIDGVLSLRQRVELRFFLERFKRDLREQVGRLRDRSPGRRPARPPGRRRP